MRIKRQRCHLSPMCCLSCSIYIATFAIVMPLIGWDLVYSFYRSRHLTTSSMTARAMKENSREFHAAGIYLSQQMNHLTGPLDTSTSKIKLVVIVVTVPRTLRTQSLGYLTRTVVSIHQQLKKTELLSFEPSLLVCNVNAGPSQHEEVETLRRLVVTFDRFPNKSATAAIMNPFEKEKQDYAFCLHAGLNFSTPHLVMMVEDDAVATSELFETLTWILALRQTQATGNGNFNWSLIKLFYPARWQGYSIQFRSVLELVSIFVIGGSLGTALRNVSFEPLVRRQRCVRARLYFFTDGFYLMLLALSIGRQHILEFKRLAPSLSTLTEAPACCSPAILYSADFATKLVKYLSNDVTCSNVLPLDAAVNAFAKTCSEARYLVEPNLFKHIGLISTMKGYSQHPEEFLI